MRTFTCCLCPVNLTQNARQFLPGHAHLGSDLRDGLALPLNIDRLSAVDHAIQDRVAVAGQLYGADFHAAIIRVLLIQTRRFGSLGPGKRRSPKPRRTAEPAYGLPRDLSSRRPLTSTP